MRLLMKTVCAVFASAVITGQASAATARFDQASYSLSDTDSTLTVDLLLDLEGESTTGGSIDIGFDDSLLDYASFAFSADLSGRDLAFDVTPDLFDENAAQPAIAPNRATIGFGNFGGLSFPAEITVGTLVFDVIGDLPFSTMLTLGDGSFDPFFNSVTFNPIDVSFTSSTVTAAVPLPAGAYLFLSALLPLLGRIRKQA